MPPNISNNEMLVEEPTSADMLEKLEAPQAAPRVYQVVWFNILTFGYGHIASLYGLWLCFSGAVKWQTMLLALVLYVVAELGITAGAHRLWSHRAYRATRPLQILLMLFNCVSFQNTATDWVRDHRMHHKYSDTDGDPHNASRGFFYSHVGWLLVRKHPEVKRRGRTIDMTDIYNNPVLRFQKRYAVPLIGTICFLLPTALPVWCWGESLNSAWHMTVLRYVGSLNIIFLVNSAAHIWGYKPYDKNILPTQNIPVSIAMMGEGFHNYHHAFPWDYRASEMGHNYLNLTTKLIDFFASIGWAYDLKSASQDMVERRKNRTGDGTDLNGQMVG